VLKLARLVPHEQEDLLNITLRLLLNLSFDSAIRSQIMKSGYLPKLVNLLSKEKYVIEIQLFFRFWSVGVTVFDYSLQNVTAFRLERSYAFLTVHRSPFTVPDRFMTVFEHS
jgi:hypothetical protein